MCVAGNIPEDRFVKYFVETLKKDLGGDIRNRYEVPATFELRAVLAMSEEAWSLRASIGVT